MPPGLRGVLTYSPPSHRPDSAKCRFISPLPVRAGSSRRSLMRFFTQEDVGRPVFRFPIRGVGASSPDPIRPHRPAFSQNAPLTPARGLRMGVSLFAGSHLGLSFIPDAHSGFCVLGDELLEQLRKAK